MMVVPSVDPDHISHDAGAVPTADEINQCVYSDDQRMTPVSWAFYVALSANFYGEGQQYFGSAEHHETILVSLAFYECSFVDYHVVMGSVLDQLVLLDDYQAFVLK